MTNQNNKNFVITKKIAKHGNQSIIIIPRILQEKISAGMLVKVTIDLLDAESFVDVKVGGREA